MNWTDMELFRGIDLNDSFVLGWRCDGDRLVYDLEFSIWPDSKYYQIPKDGEYTCYRKGVLIFEGIKALEGLVPVSEARSSTDSTGEVDYGNIDTLTVGPDGVHIIGDFGSVEIAGGTCSLSIST